MKMFADLVTSEEFGMTFFLPAPEPASITSVTPHSIFVNDTDSGPDVELDCRVSGFPPPKITWTKDGKEIKKCYKSHPCEKIQRYILTSHNGLIIRKKNLSLDDQGVYRCEAENAFGRAFKEIVVDLPSKSFVWYLF